MNTLAEEIVRLTEHYEVSFRRVADGDVHVRLTEYDGHTHANHFVSMVALEEAHVGADGILVGVLRWLESVLLNAREDVK